ncbi:MAG: ATP-binding cassette domain-containing protein [Candidatus Sedimenticola sp. (ex Thyasira tokunagai)]
MSTLTLKGFQCHNLHPIDLVVPAGGFTTLTGPSGCGKTRLLRALADLDPHEGEIRLDERAQVEISPPAWRQQVGLLPAESHWWEEQVKGHFKAAADDLLESLGLPVECMEWSIQHISSGERQRLALARLLSIAPKVLLLDEPTANLDQQNIRRVETVIESYLKQHNAAVLWVSHDPAQRRRLGGRHLTIADGGIEEERWS